MKFLDTFAGVGGFRLGLEAAGHECVGFIEWDKDARCSYEAIHDTRGEWNEGDIRTVRPEDIPRADIWCGGWPCQDISKNGSKSGLKGNRSKLFFTVTGLIEQLKEKDKPSYLFLENVANLRGSNRGFDFIKVLLELERIGYDAEWQIINSRQFGLPQNRERIFIIGHLRGRSTRRIFPISGRDSGVKLSRPEDGWAVKNATKKGFDIATEYDAVNLSFPDSKTRRGRVGKGYFQTLDRSCNQAVFDPHKKAWRRITPLEAWRIQGFPDSAYKRAYEALKTSGLTEKKVREALYSQAGNSVSVPVIHAIAKRFDIDGAISSQKAI